MMPGEDTAKKSVESIPEKQRLPVRRQYNRKDFSTDFLGSVDVSSHPFMRSNCRSAYPLFCCATSVPLGSARNETRLKNVSDMAKFVIEARIITGDVKGEAIMMFKIAFSCGDDVSAFV